MRFKREGTHVCLHLIHLIVQQKLTERCKGIIHQLKNKFKEEYTCEKTKKTQARMLEQNVSRFLLRC